MTGPDDQAARPLDPDRALALAYVPAGRRAAIAALWALDLRMAELVRAAREPALGTIRLAWWRDALAALDSAPPPGEPLLARIAATLLPGGVSGARLSLIPEGWAPLLEPEGADDAALEVVAVSRGGAAFAAAASVLGHDADDRVRAAGEAWALTDIAFGFADPAFRARALRLAAGRLSTAGEGVWPAGLRPIGMLAMLAARDAARGTRDLGSPARALRMLRHRLTGR